MFFESLEKRRLLAFSIGSLTANIDSGGKLTIQGGTTEVLRCIIERVIGLR